MIISSHQPAYLPWLGYFNKMSMCDVWVIYNDTQFTPKEFQNRNRIRTKDGSQWLTIPVQGGRNQLIDEVQIDSTQDWKRKHLKSIEQNYSKALYFDQYKHLLEDMYDDFSDKCGFTQLLSNFNVVHMASILYELGMESVVHKWRFASDLDLQESKSDRVLEMCKKLNATKYIFGFQGQDYADVQSFTDAGIEVEFQNFQHPTYSQCYPGFHPNMCVLDALFNLGSEGTRELIYEV